MFKKILKITGLLLLFSGIIALFAFSNIEQQKLKLQKISVGIDESFHLQFVDEMDVLEILKNQGGANSGVAISTLNLAKIEQSLLDHPHIEKAEVFLTIDGILDVQVKQRRPIVRVMNVYNEGFYIDENGVLMPLSDKFSYKTLVANGLIFERYNSLLNTNMADSTVAPELKKNLLLDDIFALARFVDKDSIWKAQIQQVYVDKEIELIPRVGNQRIILGEIKELPEKFEKLNILYRKAMPKVGWNSYSIINLKFKDQVVCTKAK